MKNLAKAQECDDQIRRELEANGVEVLERNVLLRQALDLARQGFGEVIQGTVHGDDVDIDELRKRVQRLDESLAEVPNRKTEVPYSIVGKLGVWKFRRGWYYWMVSAPRGKGIPQVEAEELNATWWSEIRVGGVGAASVEGSLSGNRTVDSYHIDTPEGLSAFVNLVRNLTE